MSANGWERVASQGKTVYWRRHLADGSYLSVKRSTDGVQWAHRGPAMDVGTHGYRVRAMGRERDVRQARAAADRYALGMKL